MEQSEDKMTVLFAPLDFHGHVNACHGIAEELRDRGHTVVFAIEKVCFGANKLIAFFTTQRGVYNFIDPSPSPREPQPWGLSLVNLSLWASA